jgi:acetyl esterase/lipase
MESHYQKQTLAIYTVAAIATPTTTLSTAHTKPSTIPLNSPILSTPAYQAATSPVSDPQPSSFHQYASKLGYSEKLIDRAFSDLGAEATTDDLLSHIIYLQDGQNLKDPLLSNNGTLSPPYHISLQDVLNMIDSLTPAGRDDTALPPYHISIHEVLKLMDSLSDSLREEGDSRGH